MDEKMTGDLWPNSYFLAYNSKNFRVKSSGFFSMKILWSIPSIDKLKYLFYTVILVMYG